MKTIISICIALFFTFVCACERVEENYLSENVEYAAAQYDLLIEKLEKKKIHTYSLFNKNDIFVICIIRSRI
jgi:hypothetical protein